MFYGHLIEKMAITLLHGHKPQKNTARDMFDNKCINKTNSDHIILSFTCKSLTQCTSFSGTYPLTLSGWDPLTLFQAFPGIP